VIYGRPSVLVARWSGSLNFESRTPFHGLAMLSEGRHADENGGVLLPGDRDENWARGVA